MADASLNPKMILSGLRLRGPVSKHIYGKVEGFPLFSRCIVWVANIIWICFDGDFGYGFCHHGLGNIF